MNALEFKKDFLDGVKAAATATGEGSSASFVDNMASYLIDYELLPDYTACYFVGDYKRKKYRVDGYSFDEFDQTMNIIIADYHDMDDRTLNRSTAKQIFEKVRVFLDAALHSNLYREVDISLPVSDLIDTLRENKDDLRKIRIFLFTSADMSTRIKTLEIENIDNISVEAQIWDISRIYEVCTQPELENIEIDFSQYGIEGIPCLRANIGQKSKYTSYLGVIPGSILSDIYDKYGSRLLEGNVRSFLSTKGAVNRKIRETIINRPEMFFAFNNGISVTAKNVSLVSHNQQLYIQKATDFQIINGGQTTASLYNAKKNNRADLSSIFVQMKLTEIDDNKVSEDEANTLIRDISRSSNSQNKVSDADFFSSHPFHRQMEQISKITYAPAKEGAQYETIWFYERARGQYLQEQMRLTPAKQKAFLLKNPKNQLIKKTDLARVQNSWLGHPDTVSKGAQTNFVKFAKDIDEEWQKNNEQFNEYYFKSTVALMIMYKYLGTYISHQDWYEGGYRANIITYSMALLHELIKNQFNGADIDMMQIWNKQDLPDEIKNALAVITKDVFYSITAPNRPIMNVTQWCKKNACWEHVKRLNIKLDPKIVNCLAIKEEIKEKKKTANKDQWELDGINAMTEVVKYPASHWQRLNEFAMEHNILGPSDVTALRIAMQIPRKLPNSVQARRLLELESRARLEGFRSED